MKKILYEKFFNFQSRHWWFQARKSIVTHMLEQAVVRNQVCGNKLLDMGCGCGVMLDSLKLNYDCMGVDASDDAIEFASTSSGLTLLKGSLPNKVPLPDNSFDIILALDVIEHIPDDQSSLLKVYDLLKPGGVAIITVPAYQWLWTEHDNINQHQRRYTLRMLQSLIDNTEFKLEKISYFNFFLFPIILVVRLLQKWLKPTEADILKLPGKKINQILFKIFSSEKKLLSKYNFPFGLSIIAVVSKR